MGILRDFFGRIFAGRRATANPSRLADVLGRDKEARAQEQSRAAADRSRSVESRLTQTTIGDNQARTEQEARRRAEDNDRETAEARLEKILKGDIETRQEQRQRREQEQEPEDKQPLGERPKERTLDAASGRLKWIPAASSLVDAFYWEPSKDNPDMGRLWIRFTTKSGKPGQEGYYQDCTETQYDDLFMAPSKGEWLVDYFIKPKIKYNRTGRGALIGTRLPWPRRGSRGGNLTPGSWWSRTGRQERASPRFTRR